MIIRCKPDKTRRPPTTLSPTFNSIPAQLKRVESSLRGAKRNVEIMRMRIERLEKVRKLAIELCESVDAKSEDVGGTRHVLEILRDLGKAADEAAP